MTSGTGRCARYGSTLILVIFALGAGGACLRAQSSPSTAAAPTVIGSEDEARWRTASAFFARGLYWEAERRFAHLAEKLPRVAKVHFGHGAALVRSDRPRQALAAFDRALTLGLKDAQCHLMRAGVLETLGKPDQALAAYRKGVRLAPDHAELRLRFGTFLDRRGDRAAAAMELSAARRLRPKHAPTLHASAAFAFRGEDLGAARRLAASAVKADPQAPAPRYLLSRIAAREKKREEAREHARIFRRLRKEADRRRRAEATAQARVALAYEAWREGKLEAAVIYFESALEAKARDEQARSGLEVLAAKLPPKSPLRQRVAKILERDQPPPRGNPR